MFFGYDTGKGFSIQLIAIQGSYPDTEEILAEDEVLSGATRSLVVPDQGTVTYDLGKRLTSLPSAHTVTQSHTEPSSSRVATLRGQKTACSRGSCTSARP